MAVTILGSGYSPVGGSRDFDAVGGGGQVAISGVPSNNQLAVWTGSATLEGEPDLTYDGTTLNVDVVTVNIPNGLVLMPGVAAWSGSAVNLVDVDASTGELKHNASGGGTTNFLRADGSWSIPGVNSSANGITTTNNVVTLGGTLNSGTTIGGNSMYAMNMTYLNGFYVHSFGSVSLLFDDGVSHESSIVLSGGSMLVTDTGQQKGLQYAADYSTNGASLGDRWIPDKKYVDKAISDQVKAATTGYLVARSQITIAGQGSTTNIISVPDGSIIWDIKLYTSIAWDSPMAFKIGTDADDDRYENDSALLSTSTGWITLSLSDIPDVMSATTQITALHTDILGATTGESYIYVIYSTFS